jgi:hypothetical protein
MNDDFPKRARMLSREERQARDAKRRIEAEHAMREHEAAQKALYENRERLKAQRLAQEALSKEAQGSRCESSTVEPGDSPTAPLRG